MGETLDALKALIAPAVVALILFIVTNYVALPLWRRYQTRYSQYIPVRSITTHTTSVRLKLQAVLARWFVPSNWRRTRIAMGVDEDDEDDSRLSEDLDYVSVDEEELEDVYINHREAGSRRHGLSLDARYPSPRLDDSSRRLSRDLEQGFRDDSESEEDDPRQRR